MRKYLSIFALLFGLVCLTTGCNNDEEQPVIPALSTEMEQELTVPFEGESFTITYSITTKDRPYVDSNDDCARVVSS